MQRGERSELVEEFVGGVDGLGVFAADGIEEAVLLGEEARRHAWVGCEGDEAQEVGETHHAAGCSELIASGRGVVVPCKEAKDGQG